MEKEHTQSVVERAYAFVEDMFGLKRDDTTQLSEPGPRITPGLPPTTLTRMHIPSRPSGNFT